MITNERHDNAYVGATLWVYKKCEQVMSDIFEMWTWADCWDEAQQKIVSVMLASDYGTRKPYTATVDATPETVAKAAAWKDKEFRKAEQRRAECAAEKEARTFRSGKRVQVVSGRKIPVGTEGVIFWMGRDNWHKLKLGIATTDRKENGRYADVLWVAQSNCELIGQESLQTA